MPRLATVATLLPLVFATPLAAGGDETTVRVEREVARLQAIASVKPSDPDAAQLLEEAGKGLAKAHAALAAGRLYLGVEELGKASSLLGGGTAMQSPQKAFDVTWAHAKERLDRADREARARDWTGAAEAVRALSESAQGKSLTLLEASRAYSTVTSVGAGLFYLGQANGVADFAAVAHGLEAKGRGAAIPLRSIATELAALQHRVNTAFQPPRSIDMHPAFIQLNATLKTATELDAAKFYAGALYQYLDAVAQLALVEAPGTTTPVPDTPARTSMADRLARSPNDDSLAELFLQRAEYLLDPNPDAAARENNVRRANAILGQTLPAYFAVVNAAPPTSSASASLASVNVTLVRWPYT